MKQRILNAIASHPKLTTAVVGVGITVVVGAVLGIANVPTHLAYAPGGACHSCI